MKELKFIHISKCAGSFISHIGKLHGLEWGAYHREYSRGQKTHEEFCKKPEWLKAKYDWFMVVRNPYNRILSEYYYKLRADYNVHESNKYLIQRVATRGCNPPLTVGHYIEQYKYLDPVQTIHIIKYENMYSELKSLFSNYNIDINLDNYIEQKMNSKELHTTNTSFTTDNFNNTLIRYINRIYKKDFATFNYDMINTYDYIV